MGFTFVSGVGRNLWLYLTIFSLYRAVVHSHWDVVDEADQ